VSLTLSLSLVVGWSIDSRVRRVVVGVIIHSLNRIKTQTATTIFYLNINYVKRYNKFLCLECLYRIF